MPVPTRVLLLISVLHVPAIYCIPLLSLSEIITKFRHDSQRHLTRESGFDPHFSESDRRGVSGFEGFDILRSACTNRTECNSRLELRDGDDQLTQTAD